MSQMSKGWKREYDKQYFQEHKETIYAHRRASYDPVKEKARKEERKKNGYYQKNRAYYDQKNDERRQMLRDFILEQKVGRVCERCGISDIRVLDFHHLDRDGKEGSIGKAVSKNWSKERIVREIAKCQVLCSNCHRILHWEERHGQRDTRPVRCETRARLNIRTG